MLLNVPRGSLHGSFFTVFERTSKQANEAGRLTLISQRGGQQNSSFRPSPFRLIELNSALERARRRGELRAALTSPRRALLCALSPSAPRPRALAVRAAARSTGWSARAGPGRRGELAGHRPPLLWLRPAPFLSPASPFTRHTRLNRPDHFTRPTGLGALLTHFLCAACSAWPRLPLSEPSAVLQRPRLQLALPGGRADCLWRARGHMPLCAVALRRLQLPTTF
jgi:hypothetical protein